MSLPTQPSQPGPAQRRSRRVLLELPIVVQRSTQGEDSILEKTRTLVVNAHGALLLLAASVEVGQTLVLQNPKSEEAQKCRVVYLGPTLSGKTQVGVEFVEPAPHFWPVAFPPDDWAPRSAPTPSRPAA